MKFNANDYVNEHLTAEEVHEIKVGFDLFDRDMGGAIDPRGNFYLLFLNSESLSPPSVSIQKPSQSIK
jgi:Ca2+-binding EF-hand superfamily protein